MPESERGKLAAEKSVADEDRREDPAADDEPDSILRHSVPEIGTSPGIEVHELSKLPSSSETIAITCVDYCPERVQILDVNNIPDFLARHRPEWSAVRWINIEGLSNMAVIQAFAEKYELHPLAIEDVIHLGQRPKVEDYPASAEHPGRLFLVTQWVEMIDDRLRSEQVSFFLGRKTLLTFQERPSNVFANILPRLRSKDSRLRRNDASFLLYSLLDATVDHYFPILEEISERLDDLEEAVLGKGAPSLFEEIHHFRRDLAMIRRIAWPMRELVNNLTREQHECLSETTKTYLRDVYDHVIQVLDLIETYRDFGNTLTETHMSATSNRMNDIVKTLTIISTIFVPLTFLAGVYGMNMPIPENGFAGSYPVFWLVALGIGIGMMYWFRWRGWL